MSETTDGLRPAARLGAELRAARLRLGWELPDLAGSLRIRQSYLEAIEAGRMAELPGTTYALGFVRTYASALGLPGEEVSGRFRAEAEEVQNKPTLSFPAPVPQRGVPAGALMLLGMVILVGAYGGWYYVTEHQHTPAETVPPIPDRLLPQAQAPGPPKSQPSPQVASILPSASPPSPAPEPPEAAPAKAAPPPPQAVVPPPPQPATLPPATLPKAEPPPLAAAPAPLQAAAAPGPRVLIKISADAWVTIKQKSGAALINKLMHAGDSFAVPADRADLTLTTGNAGGTEIDVDGAAIAGVGGSGMVRRDLPLDPEALKAGRFPPIGRAKPKPAPAPLEN